VCRVLKAKITKPSITYVLRNNFNMQKEIRPLDPLALENKYANMFFS